MHQGAKSPQPPIPISHDAIADGVDLRILPLGDSITSGECSSDGNGYRSVLAELIKHNGNNLTYVGSIKSGSLPNNEHEGHGGFQTLAIGQMGKPVYSMRPNIVLLMAGTSDIIFQNDVMNAPARLEMVVQDIFSAYPDAVVLVSTLLPLLNAQISSLTVSFNTQLMGIIWKFTEQGKKVDLVDMGRVTPALINATDGYHPTDEGYALVATLWHNSIVKAGDNGWIREPFQDHDFPHVQDRTQSDSLMVQPTIRLAPFMFLSAFFVRKAIKMFLRRYRR